MQEKIDPTSSSQEKLLRLFCILLYKPGKHFLKELSENLKCSKQSVIRMIESITHVFPTELVKATQDKQTYYELVPSKKSALLGSVDKLDEFKYLSLCRELAEPYLTEDNKLKIDKCLMELSISLAQYSLREKLKNNDKTYAFYSRGKIDYNHHQKFIDIVNSAIENSLLCKIHYASLNSEPKLYYILPKQFICKNEAIYVLGAKTNKDATDIEKIVTFALHRIKSVTLMQKVTNLLIPEPDLTDFGLPWHEPKTYVITFKKGIAIGYIKERTWADSQKMRDLDNGELELTITTKAGPEILSWVRSYGIQIKSVTDENGNEIDVNQDLLANLR